MKLTNGISEFSRRLSIVSTSEGEIKSNRNNTETVIQGTLYSIAQEAAVSYMRFQYLHETTIAIKPSRLPALCNSDE